MPDESNLRVAVSVVVSTCTAALCSYVMLDPRNNLFHSKSHPDALHNATKSIDWVSVWLKRVKCQMCI